VVGPKGHYATAELFGRPAGRESVAPAGVAGEHGGAQLQPVNSPEATMVKYLKIFGAVFVSTAIINRVAFLKAITG
jgi:hypothetical protein